MGLTGKSLARFRDRVETTLEDMFPCQLLINGTTITASGPGARIVSEFMDAGKTDNIRVSFRVPKAALSWTPAKDHPVAWIVSATLTIPLEISEFSIRPQETRHAITCRKRRS